MSEQHFEYNDLTILPVRCFQCQKVIGNKEQIYKKKLSEGKSIEQALNEMNIVRTCCRMNIMNPPKIPLALQLNNQTEEIKNLYNSFNISPISNNQNLEIINASGREEFNPQPLTNLNRPRRIYELTKRSKNTVFNLENTDIMSSDFNESEMPKQKEFNLNFNDFDKALEELNEEDY